MKTFSCTVNANGSFADCRNEGGLEAKCLQPAPYLLLEFNEDLTNAHVEVHPNQPGSIVFTTMFMKSGKQLHIEVRKSGIAVMASFSLAVIVPSSGENA